MASSVKKVSSEASRIAQSTEITYQRISGAVRRPRYEHNFIFILACCPSTVVLKQNRSCRNVRSLTLGLYNAKPHTSRPGRTYAHKKVIMAIKLDSAQTNLKPIPVCEHMITTRKSCQGNTVPMDPFLPCDCYI